MRIILCGSVLVVCMSSRAQDTLHLDVAEVRASMGDISATGRRVQSFDSITRAAYPFASVGDLLRFNSPLTIRSYAPGGVSTASFRGGSASQTAILWNGLNVQNNMLGQADLSLLPAFFFEDTRVEYGGSASVWGSGAAAGSIQLRDGAPFNAGTTYTIMSGGGSFGQNQLSGGVRISRARFVSVTKAYHTGAINDFDFIDADGNTRALQNGAFRIGGVSQQVRWLHRKHHVFNLNGWISYGSRDLPEYNRKGGASQEDLTIRFAPEWKYARGRFVASTKGGYFEEYINYRDMHTLQRSSATARTFIAENELSLRRSDHTLLSAGVNVMHASAVTADYAGSRSITRASLLGGFRRSLLKQRLIFSSSARGEYFSTGRLPVTGSLAAELKPGRSLLLGLSAARVYRQPTLNEMYWIPGGNPSLRPEHGYTAEGHVSYTVVQQSGSARDRFSSVVTEGAVYSRYINDWILWIPGSGGNPSPRNIQSVWSRGSEATVRFSAGSRKMAVAATIITAYVLSTVEEVQELQSAATGKQLPYTPRYTVNDNLNFRFHNTSVFIAHQYAGYRFTSSDNTSWLDPYNIINIRITQRFNSAAHKVSCFIGCNNLTNERYAQFAGRPLPGRAFEFGLILNNKIKTQKNEN